MRHWNRTAHVNGDALDEYLKNELRRRWPEFEFPFHIEVIGDRQDTGVTVRVWDGHGVSTEVVANPVRFVASLSKSPTVAAVLYAVQTATTEAARTKGIQP